MMRSGTSRDASRTLSSTFRQGLRGTGDRRRKGEREAVAGSIHRREEPLLADISRADSETLAIGRLSGRRTGRGETFLSPSVHWTLALALDEDSPCRKVGIGRGGVRCETATTMVLQASLSSSPPGVHCATYEPYLRSEKFKQTRKKEIGEGVIERREGLRERASVSSSFLTAHSTAPSPRTQYPVTQHKAASLYPPQGDSEHLENCRLPSTRPPLCVGPSPTPNRPPPASENSLALVL